MIGKVNIVEGKMVYRTGWLTKGIWVDLDVISKLARTCRCSKRNQKREDFGGLRNL